MIDIFRSRTSAARAARCATRSTFMDQQLAERSKQLEDAEQRRLAFEAKHPDLAGGTEAIIAQMSGYRAQLRDVEADLAAAQSALAATRRPAGRHAQDADRRPADGGPRAALAQARGQSGGDAGARADRQPSRRDRGREADRRAAASRRRAPGAISRHAQPGLHLAAGDPRRAPGERRGADTRAPRRCSSRSPRSSANQAQAPAAAAEAKQISHDYDVLRRNTTSCWPDREELRLRGQVETEHSSVKFDVVDPPTHRASLRRPTGRCCCSACSSSASPPGAAPRWAMGKLRSTFATASKLETALSSCRLIGTISHTLTEAARALRRSGASCSTPAPAASAVLFVVLLAAEFVQRSLVGMTEQSKIPLPRTGKGKSLFERAEDLFGFDGFAPAPACRARRPAAQACRARRSRRRLTDRRAGSTLAAEADEAGQAPHRARSGGCIPTAVATARAGSRR